MSRLTASPAPMAGPPDCFLPAAAEVPAIARVFQAAAGLALFALAVVFARGAAPLTPRYRLELVLVAVVLLACAWSVQQGRAGMAARLWLLFAVGTALSLSVPKANLQRPPGMPAAVCGMVLGAAGLAFILCLGRRFVRTGMEAALLVAVLGTMAVLALFFSSVAVQNSLDIEVLHNTLGELLDYSMALCGAAALSADRRSYVPSAVVVASALVVRAVLHHAVS